MEVFETEIEIYNSKLRLLNWIVEEINLQSDIWKEEIKEKAQNLPINL